jgi:phosphoenolpyruvate carboxykinase (ATP)
LHGRRVKDTYAVAWPEVVDQIWWKADVQQYDPAKYQGLLQRVLDHLNAKKATLYVKDVFVGADPRSRFPTASSASTRRTRCSRTTCSRRT